MEKYLRLKQKIPIRPSRNGKGGRLCSSYEPASAKMKRRICEIRAHINEEQLLTAAEFLQDKQHQDKDEVVDGLEIR